MGFDSEALNSSALEYTQQYRSRLIGGTTGCDGWLQSDASGTWGDVCDDSFHNSDGLSHCRATPGCGDTTSVAVTLSYSVTGRYDFTTYNWACAAGVKLDQCVWSNGDVCTSSEHVHLDCTLPSGQSAPPSRPLPADPTPTPTPSPNPTPSWSRAWQAPSGTFEVRFTGGANRCQGQVEVRQSESSGWYAVCDDGWDATDALSACRSVYGCHTATGATARSQAYYTSSTTLVGIGLDNVACSSGASTLDSCESNGWGNHNCVFSENAGVDCTGYDAAALQVTAEPSRTTEGPASTRTAALIGGSTGCSGWLQTNANAGSWGDACDDSFGTYDAQAVCGSVAGCENWLSVDYDTSYDVSGRPDFSTNNWDCPSTATDLDDCTFSTNDNCGSQEHVWISCTLAPGSSYPPAVQSPHNPSPDPASSAVVIIVVLVVVGVIGVAVAMIVRQLFARRAREAALRTNGSAAATTTTTTRTMGRSVVNTPAAAPGLAGYSQPGPYPQGPGPYPQAPYPQAPYPPANYGPGPVPQAYGGQGPPPYSGQAVPPPGYGDIPPPAGAPPKQFSV